MIVHIAVYPRMVHGWFRTCLARAAAKL